MVLNGLLYVGGDPSLRQTEQWTAREFVVRIRGRGFSTPPNLLQLKQALFAEALPAKTAKSAAFMSGCSLVDGLRAGVSNDEILDRICAHQAHTVVQQQAYWREQEQRDFLAENAERWAGALVGCPSPPQSVAAAANPNDRKLKGYKCGSCSACKNPNLKQACRNWIRPQKQPAWATKTLQLPEWTAVGRAALQAEIDEWCKQGLKTGNTSCKLLQQQEMTAVILDAIFRNGDGVNNAAVVHHVYARVAQVMGLEWVKENIGVKEKPYGLHAFLVSASGWAEADRQLALWPISLPLPPPPPPATAPDDPLFALASLL